MAKKQWYCFTCGAKIYPKVQSMQKIREAQRNALKIKEMFNLQGGLDAWF